MSAERRPGSAQRRQSPRIELDTPVIATDAATGHVVHLLDVSLGGLRTLSPTPGRAGVRHTFRIAFRDGSSCDVAVVAVHSHRAPGQLQRFVVGWRALPDPATQRNLQRLVTFVTTAPVIDDESAVPVLSHGEPHR